METTSTFRTLSTIDALADRLRGVRQAISKRCVELGLETQPTLVVVTKNHPASTALELLSLGETQFGENRDQEASRKAAEVAEQSPEVAPTWHFVGQLQTNKVKSVLGYSSWIHTLDRPSLLSELNKRAEQLAREKVNVFIEVNLTDREDRGGVQPAALLSFADQVAGASHLNLVGLMAVARPEVDARIDFERMVKIQAGFLANHPRSTQLSMGMSSDYLQAIEYGATHLRIGTAITGPRVTQN